MILITRLWVTTYISPAKNFCQSVQELQREAKWEGEKNDKSGNCKAFAKCKLKKLKVRSRCRTGNPHLQRGRDPENFKKTEKRGRWNILTLHVGSWGGIWELSLRYMGYWDPLWLGTVNPVPAIRSSAVFFKKPVFKISFCENFQNSFWKEQLGRKVQ